jgi:glycine hydroxymethyltransferase
MTPGFKAYAKQVKANAVAIGNYLMSKGYKMVTDGTENHLVLWDLRPLGLTGIHLRNPIRLHFLRHIL